MIVATWIVVGFFTAFGWHYGEKFIVTYIDKPEPRVEQKASGK